MEDEVKAMFEQPMNDEDKQKTARIEGSVIFEIKTIRRRY